MARPNKRLLLKLFAAVLVASGLLACASFITTDRMCCGAFPTGEFRVNIRDSEGAPVKGARCLVFYKGTDEASFGCPIDNFVAGEDLLSDDKGQIRLRHICQGIEFGGEQWDLFWLIPMGWKVPDFDCEITAPGYKPYKLPVSRLFAQAYNYDQRGEQASTFVSDGNGGQRELYVFEQTVVLQKQK
ncbi:MAG TPA: hypothetical protein VE988_05485 [Gemmataceae bacterium]|nr:hypothetical protein [Gemmataceae bacterium]